MTKFYLSVFIFLLLSPTTGKAAKSADYLLYLKNRADLNLPHYLQNLEDRKHFVVHALRTTARQSQAPVIAKLRAIGLEFQSYYVVNAILVLQAEAEEITEIAKMPEIERIVKDETYSLAPSLLPSSAPPANELHNDLPQSLRYLNIGQVWAELGIRGEGIVIGGQDSGYAWSHPAIRRQYRGSIGLGVNHNYNWHDAIRRPLKKVQNSCGYALAAPCDDTGHGTHTMGTMVGDDGATNKIGVAPEARWVGCRNMDAGDGRASTYLECFEFFLAPYPFGGDPQRDGRPDLAPQIVNNSWACPRSEGCQGQEFVDVARAYAAAGILLVVAAGNEGPSCASLRDAPGTYGSLLLSVAALDSRNGEIASFSSRGPSAFDQAQGPNVAAPGVNIRSAVHRGGINNSGYDYKSGTSMAAPHAAGIAALLWAYREELRGDVRGTLAHLAASAVPRTTSQNCGAFAGSQVPNAVFGHGALDAYRALRSRVLGK